VQEVQTDEQKQVRQRRAPQHHVFRDVTQQPKQQRMQREESKLPAACVFDIERLAQVTFVREHPVVGHVGAPHRLAQLPRDPCVFKSDERFANVGGRVGNGDDLKMAHANEDKEDQTARQHPHIQRVAQRCILPESNEPLVVEQFSESL